MCVRWQTKSRYEFNLHCHFFITFNKRVLFLHSPCWTTRVLLLSLLLNAINILDYRTWMLMFLALTFMLNRAPSLHCFSISLPSILIQAGSPVMKWSNLIICPCPYWLNQQQQQQNLGPMDYTSLQKELALAENVWKKVCPSETDEDSSTTLVYSVKTVAERN